MDIGISVLFIVMILLSNWQGYRRGRRKGTLEGIEGSLDHLIETGRLDVLDAIEAQKSL